MVFRNLAELRGATSTLLVAMMMALSLGALGLPFPTIRSAHATPVPQINGPLVPTTPFTFDIECPTSSSPNCSINTDFGNYRRLIMYSWEVDPAVNGDPNHDYFL